MFDHLNTKLTAIAQYPLYIGLCHSHCLLPIALSLYCLYCLYCLYYPSLILHCSLCFADSQRTLPTTVNPSLDAGLPIVNCPISIVNSLLIAGLPIGLPSTFLGKHGWVQYYCKTALKEASGLAHKNQQVFIVMNPIDLNQEPAILAVSHFSQAWTTLTVC